MTSTVARPDFAKLGDPLQQLVTLSRFYGGNPDFILATGGNASVKIGEQLYVKESGAAMATIDKRGYVELTRGPLDRLLDGVLRGSDEALGERFLETVMGARTHPELGQRPSGECLLHHVLPSLFVMRTHATQANILACSKDGRSRVSRLFGDDALWIPYVNPPGIRSGKMLYEALLDYRKRTGNACPKAVFMANHGLIVCGDTPDEIRETTESVVCGIDAHLGTASEEPFGKISSCSSETTRKLVMVMGPALRALLGGACSMKVVTFDDSGEAIALSGGTEGRAVASGGPLTPDQAMHCGVLPMWFRPRVHEAEESLVEQLRDALTEHRKAAGSNPRVIVVQGLGIFAVGDTYAVSKAVLQRYREAIRLMCGARGLGGVQYIAPEHRAYFARNVVKSSVKLPLGRRDRRRGRADKKVVVVTSSAQGLGLELAQHFAEQDAHVALADIDEEVVHAAAAHLNRREGEGRALSVAVDVSSSASISDALYQVVRSYGGFDVFVANGAVSTAEGVEERSGENVDFDTASSYKSYLQCVEQVAPILAVQHQANPAYTSDIIQINTKLSHVGSSQNAAYVGSEFGAIGLMQSFARAFIKDGVKVNAVCPGNFFDTPVWSDSETGILAQYLRSGKFVGAETVEEVRRACEPPMGRGCTAADVMRAIYYLVEQQYETGQTLPVTGGQAMGS